MEQDHPLRSPVSELADRIQRNLPTPKSNQPVRLPELDDEVSSNWSLVLFGKLFSSNFISDGKIEEMLNKQWMLGYDVKIKAVVKGTFKWEVKNQEEKTKLLQDGPWVVGGNIFSVKSWEKNVQLEKMDFHMIDFWIQIYQLPVERLNEQHGALLGAYLGRVVCTDPQKYAARIRIERLNVFCFHCGRLGHEQKICANRYFISKSTLIPGRRFNCSLRGRSPDRCEILDEGVIPSKGVFRTEVADGNFAAVAPDDSSKWAGYSGDKQPVGNGSDSASTAMPKNPTHTAMPISKPHLPPNSDAQCHNFDVHPTISTCPAKSHPTVSKTSSPSQVSGQHSPPVAISTAFGRVKALARGVTIGTSSPFPYDSQRGKSFKKHLKKPVLQKRTRMFIKNPGLVSFISALKISRKRIRNYEELHCRRIKRRRLQYLLVENQTAPKSVNPWLMSSDSSNGKQDIKTAECQAEKSNPTEIVVNADADYSKAISNSGERGGRSSVPIPEVKCSKEVGLRRSRILSFPNKFLVPSDGTKGGFWLFWCDYIKLDIIYWDQHCINTRVHHVNPCFDGIFTFIHAPHISVPRAKFWSFLSSWGHINESWVIIGDFNETLAPWEKWRSNWVSSPSSRSLEDFVAKCFLQDVGSSGPCFTWTNDRCFSRLAKSRIDKAFVNKCWHSKNPKSIVLNSPILYSDHSPILFTTDPLVSKPTRHFFFKSFWLENQQCLEIIKNGWKSFGLFNCVQACLQNLRNIKSDVLAWHKIFSKNLHSEIADLQSMIQKAQETNLSENLHYYEKELRVCLDILEKKEESFWRDKNRELFLELGDKNTSFFHKSVQTRRNSNRIICLKVNDDWCFDQNLLEMHAVDFFSKLFKTSNPSLPTELPHVHPVILDDENDKLLKDFKLDEIKEALFSMKPNKAPGRDGFTPFFYQKNWNCLKDDLLKLMNFLLRNSSNLRFFNQTSITLIPKISQPTLITHFRPISLCNVLYRIFSKALANRLKLLLDKIITPFQTAFRKGKLIGDNVVLAREIMHSLGKKKGVQGCMAIKLDMHKAFDQIEWCFLLQMLTSLGFSSAWCEIIHNCISTPVFSINLNGKFSKEIVPSRGLRQGDPLSPFLFIICSDFLSRLLHYYESSRHIHGIKIGRFCAPVSHLMFADDCFLFCRANLSEVSHVHDCINLYCQLSGQTVNFDKSSLSFSKNLHHRFRRMLSRRLHIPWSSSSPPYLGIVIAGAKTQCQNANSVLRKMKSKMNAWRYLQLSRAGKGTLISAVSNSLPVYPMQTQLFPVAKCEEIDKSNRDFWWNSGMEEGSSCHFLSWDVFLAKKSLGGLGLRNARFQNLSLLGKYVWRLLSQDESPCFSTLKARYFRNCSFFQAKKATSGSSFWNDLISVRKIFEHEVCWSLGFDRNLNIWEDNWIPTIPFKKPMGPRPSNGPTLVHELFSWDTRQWDTTLLSLFFDPFLIGEIVKIQIPHETSHCKLRWVHERNGIFSAKSAYNWLVTSKNKFRSCGLSKRQWSLLWKLRVPLRVKLHLWRMIHNGLATKDNLLRMQAIEDDVCPRCGRSSENLLHAFFQCDFVRPIWFASILGLQVPQRQDFSLLASFQMFYQNLAKSEFISLVSLFASIAYLIWMNRNSLIFDGKAAFIEVQDLLDAAYQLIIPNHDHHSELEEHSNLQLPLTLMDNLYFLLDVKDMHLHLPRKQRQKESNGDYITQSSGEQNM